LVMVSGDGGARMVMDLHTLTFLFLLQQAFD
jgi:hypothetical protein